MSKPSGTFHSEALYGADTLRASSLAEDRWLVEVEVCDLNVPGRTLAVASAQSATTKDFLIKTSRSIDVSDGDKMGDGEPVAGRHLITLFFDLDAHSATAIPGNPNINHD